MEPDYPAHASPAFKPTTPPGSKERPLQNRDRTISNLELHYENQIADDEPPPLVSPAYTPPDLPLGGQRHDRQPQSIQIPHVEESEEDGASHTKKFGERLPNVECEVRARIPTTSGQEMWLHLYHNDADEKEHLAIVFGPHIRSKSLDAPRPGETERDRMIRGAYVGTLYPGRTSSKIVDRVKREVDQPSPRGRSNTADESSKGGLTVNASSQISEDVVENSIISDERSALDLPLVRIHSECYTGETVWSARCDCGEQLDEAARLMSLPQPTPASTPTSNGQRPLLERLAPAGGVIIYLRQEGRGIGLLSKLKAYNLQDLGHDTMEANLLLRHPGDARSYGLATAMLLDLGLGGPKGIRLLTNNPEKVRAVEGPNREIRVAERVPMIPLSWQTGGKEGINSPEVEKYISTKIEKFKHMFSS